METLLFFTQSERPGREGASPPVGRGKLRFGRVLVSGSGRDVHGRVQPPRGQEVFLLMPLCVSEAARAAPREAGELAV